MVEGTKLMNNKKLKKQNNMLGFKKKERYFLILMLSFPVLHFLIFWLYNNLSAIFLAFQDANGNFNNYEHFKWFFNDLFSSVPRLAVREGLINTLIFWAFNTFVELPIAICISYFFYKKIKGYKFYRVVLYMPSIISAVIMATVFKNFSQSDGPLALIWLNLTGNTLPPLLYNSNYAMKSLLFYNIWTGYGVNIILFTGAMHRIPTEVIESAKLDGITEFRELINIIIPLIWPIFSTIIILSIAGMFSASGPILLLTQGNYGTMTVSYSIFQQYYLFNQINRAAAIGIIYTFIGLPLLLISRNLLSKVQEDEEY